MFSTSPKSRTSKQQKPVEAEVLPTAATKPLLFKPLARAGKRTVVDIYKMMQNCQTTDEVRALFKNEKERATALLMFEVTKSTSAIFAGRVKDHWDEDQIAAVAIAHASESKFQTDTEVTSFLSAIKASKIHGPKTGSFGSKGSFSSVKALLEEEEAEGEEVEVELTVNAASASPRAATTTLAVRFSPPI